MKRIIKSMEDKYLKPSLDMVRRSFADWSNEEEADLVVRLIKETRSMSTYIPELELIMVNDEDEVIGYALFSGFHLGGKYRDELLLLSPVAVKIEWQRQHISKEIIEFGFEKAKQMGFSAVIVEGNPQNYRSRGFQTSADFGIIAGKSVGLPAPECLMVKELTAGALDRIQGVVEYTDYQCLRRDSNTSTEGGITVKIADAYKAYFNKDYLMGPNSVRLLEEMLEKYPLEKGMRVLDLGCGKGLTSLFLAKEAGVNVFATDLWISATENHTRFNEWQISDKVIPIHADANDLPFAESYFDAVVSIDSFHYFAAQPHFFEQKMLPLLKPKGVAIIGMPGLKEEIHGKEPEVILEWLDGEESEYHLFHSRAWWLKHLGQSKDFQVLMDFDLESFDEAWQDWFLSRHELALHDEEFFQKGVAQYLTTVGLVIQKV